MGLITSTDVGSGTLQPQCPYMTRGAMSGRYGLHFTDGETEALCVRKLTCIHLSRALTAGPPASRALCFPGQGKVWAEGPSSPPAQGYPGHLPVPAPGTDPTCAVLICRLRRQQGAGGQLLDPEGCTGSPAPSKLQDGRNNNVPGPACAHGCSS